MDYLNLLGRIRAYGMTQNDVAKEIGVSPATLNKKLRGHTDFTQTEIRALCCASKRSTGRGGGTPRRPDRPAVKSRWGRTGENCAASAPPARRSFWRPAPQRG